MKKRGIWIAYQPDMSDIVIFGRELDAMRYAVENQMLCKQVDLGVSVIDQVK